MQRVAFHSLYQLFTFDATVEIFARERLAAHELLERLPNIRVIAYANDQSLNYRLYAVLVHVGSSMHSGHYFSYVRSPNNRWYKADDTTMTLCDLNQVLTQHGAYILCYIKETGASASTSNGSSTADGSPTSGTSKLVYQNGKSSNSEQTMSTTLFTPRQIPVQHLSKQMNGHNGSVKPLSAPLTKPVLVSSAHESANGGSSLLTEKREPIVMRIPKLTYLTKKPIPLQNQSLIHPNSSSTSSPSSLLVNKCHSTPLLLSTTMNSNYTISSTASLSSVQSTSSPLKLIIKTSGHSTALNGLASISSSYNHDDGDDDDDEDDDEDDADLRRRQRPNSSKETNNEDDDDEGHDSGDPSESQQPAKKKQRTEESLVSPSTTAMVSLPGHVPSSSCSSRTTSMHDQPTNSPSSTSRHKKTKKKEKKKSSKHHHHRHKSRHHRHHKRSRRETSESSSRSSSSRSSSQVHSSSSTRQTDDQHRRHRQSRKHRRHRRSTSPSASPSSREPL